MDVEERLTRLEEILGVRSETDAAQVESRLTHVQSRMTKAVSSLSSLDSQWKECRDLERELIHFDSGDGILLSSSSSATTLDKPLLYKRMEVLAQKEMLEQNLKQIRCIKEYLLLDHPLNKQQPMSKSSDTKQNSLPPQVVTEAPILIQFDSIKDPSAETRLNDAQAKIQSILLETTNMASRIDNIVDQHYQIIHAINEKIQTRLALAPKQQE